MVVMKERVLADSRPRRPVEAMRQMSRCKVPKFLGEERDWRVIQMVKKERQLLQLAVKNSIEAASSLDLP